MSTRRHWNRRRVPGVSIEDITSCGAGRPSGVNIKKATFLAEVVRTLGITGANVIGESIEELGEEIAPVDFLLARALGEFEVFLKVGCIRGG